MNFIKGEIIHQGGIIFKEQVGDIIFKLPEDYAHLLIHYAGKQVILGIRPEYIQKSIPDPDEESDILELSATLDVVEPMGNEIIIYVNTSSHKLVARLAPQDLPGPGTQVTLRLAPDKLHFFDAETEEAYKLDATCCLPCPRIFSTISYYPARQYD